MTDKELEKESEIFDELVCDILKPYGVAHSYIENIVSWHERGRNEAIKALQDEVLRLKRKIKSLEGDDNDKGVDINYDLLNPENDWK